MKYNIIHRKQHESNNELLYLGGGKNIERQATKYSVHASDGGSKLGNLEGTQIQGEHANHTEVPCPQEGRTMSEIDRERIRGIH